MKLADRFGVAGYALAFGALAIDALFPMEVFSPFMIGAGVAFIIAAACTPEGEHQ